MLRKSNKDNSEQSLEPLKQGRERRHHNLPDNRDDRSSADAEAGSSALPAITNAAQGDDGTRGGALVARAAASSRNEVEDAVRDSVSL